MARSTWLGQMAVRHGVRRTVRGALTGAAVVACLVAAGGTAHAEAGDVNASDCLTGEADYDDLVAETGLGWFTTISLYCGSPATGILHIVADHAIDEGGADDENIVACMDGILYYGDEVDAGDDNDAYAAKLSDGRSATLVWDEQSNEVVTMFVDGDVSNDWAACAETVGA